MQVLEFLDKMREAAEQDIELMIRNEPACLKLLLLPKIKSVMKKKEMVGPRAATY